MLLLCVCVCVGVDVCVCVCVTRADRNKHTHMSVKLSAALLTVLMSSVLLFLSCGISLNILYLSKYICRHKIYM